MRGTPSEMRAQSNREGVDAANNGVILQSIHKVMIIKVVAQSRDVANVRGGRD